MKLSKEAITIITGELETAKAQCKKALLVLPFGSSWNIYRYWFRRLGTIRKALKDLRK